MAEVTATVPNKGTVLERSKKYCLYLIFKVFFSSDHSFFFREKWDCKCRRVKLENQLMKQNVHIAKDSLSEDMKYSGQPLTSRD